MKRLLIIAALLGLAACNEGLDPQKRLDTFASAQSPWPSTGEALAPPDGTVAQDDLAREASARVPPQVTPALLARGRERFEIFCSPCHGLDGYADGIVVARGFPHPPSFHDARLLSAPGQLFFDTITNGYGAMYSYADRVDPHDRWAIVAYIRALQLSQRSAKAKSPEVR